MSDLIDRQAAIDALSELATFTDECSEHTWMYTDDVYKAIKQLPPAQPKTGKWALQAEDYHEYYECDQCGMEVGLDDVRNFCPNCGADMRGEQDGCDS